MAVPLSNFTIVEVAKPNIGERQPSRVRADITVHLTMRDNIRSVGTAPYLRYQLSCKIPYSQLH